MLTTFYLGTHHPHWLGRDDWPSDVALFVSHRRLASAKRLPKSSVRWALDSGGFSELSMYGEWRTTAAEYVAAVRRYDEEIGNLDWAAPQDWMCEPWIVAKTGLSVAEHQRRTVDNFLDLSARWGDDGTNPFMPVLQGDQRDDYLRHWDMYDRAGINLGAYPTVPVGTVCRRKETGEIGDIVLALRLRDPDLPIHGFGVKKRSLRACGHWITSADSLAWSYSARRNEGLPECTAHKSCANCPRYALRWYRQLMAEVRRDSAQLMLF